jgi:hypothetical protein
MSGLFSAPTPFLLCALPVDGSWNNFLLIAILYPAHKAVRMANPYRMRNGDWVFDLYKRETPRAKAHTGWMEPGGSVVLWVDDLV